MSAILGILLAIVIVFRIIAIIKMLFSYDFFIGIGKWICGFLLLTPFLQGGWQNYIHYFEKNMLFVALAWAILSLAYSKYLKNQIPIKYACFIIAISGLILAAGFSAIQSFLVGGNSGIYVYSRSYNHDIRIFGQISFLACTLVTLVYLNVQKCGKWIKNACLISSIILFLFGLGMTSRNVFAAAFIIPLCIIVGMKSQNFLPKARIDTSIAGGVLGIIILMAVCFLLNVFHVYREADLFIAPLGLIAIWCFFDKSVRVPGMILFSIILLGLVAYHIDQDGFDSSDSSVPSDGGLGDATAANVMMNSTPTDSFYDVDSSPQISGTVPFDSNITSGNLPLQDNQLASNPSASNGFSVFDGNNQFAANINTDASGSTTIDSLNGSPMHILPDGSILNGLNIPDGSVSWNGGHGTIFDASGQVAYMIDGNTIYDSTHQVAYMIQGDQVVDSLGKTVMQIHKA